MQPARRGTLPGAGKVRPGCVADESEDVAAVAARYPNLELRIHRTDGRTPLESLDAMFQISGMPQPNASNRLWAEASYSAARSAGIGVMLGLLIRRR